MNSPDQNTGSQEAENSTSENLNKGLTPPQLISMIGPVSEGATPPALQQMPPVSPPSSPNPEPSAQSAQPASQEGQSSSSES